MRSNFAKTKMALFIACTIFVSGSAFADPPTKVKETKVLGHKIEKQTTVQGRTKTTTHSKNVGKAGKSNISVHVKTKNTYKNDGEKDTNANKKSSQTTVGVGVDF